MERIQVEGAAAYPVLIERGGLSRTGETLRRFLPAGEKIALVSDDRVGPLYAGRLLNVLRDAGYSAEAFFFPRGEESKDLRTWQELLSFFGKIGLPRTGAVAALGGGVTGDLAGFAAACWLRGVRVFQFPTTLLSMVDSSVGGKTGVDFGGRKNSVGAFWAPSAVICDPDTLETLPPEEWTAGSAEVLKYGILGSRPLFDRLAAGGLKSGTEEIIAECVAMKARLVAEDERDTGRRRLLNLGHTFGHAVEAVSGYRLPHGMAVGYGLVCAARLSRKLGICTPETESRIREGVRALGLPDSTDAAPETLIAAAFGDKKRTAGEMILILPEEIGRCRIVGAAPDKAAEWLRMGFLEDA